MSDVDNRIVQMAFENGQFEKNIHQTIKSLEELEKALDVNKVAGDLKTFEKEETQVAQTTEKHIKSGIDAISLYSLTIFKVKSEISDFFISAGKQALNFGKQIASTLTTLDQVNQGFSKYEQKTKAVQAIQSALPDVGFDKIEDALDELNWYSDMTSYSFTNMVDSLGKFTANGIDLDVAVKAIQGINNEAAKAGATIPQANAAMYNFSQALSSGSVKLIDWKSIENASMATKEFKEELIQTGIQLGTLKMKEGKAYAGKTMVDFQTFSQTLQKGWLTSEVLIETLGRYADLETDFGKAAFDAARVSRTFTDAVEAVKDASSTGWMKSWELIFGDLNEASALWTEWGDAVIDAVDGVQQWRNEVLEGWRSLEGRESLIQGLADIFSSLWNIIVEVKNAFFDIFPDNFAETLASWSYAVQDLGKSMQDLFGYHFSGMDMVEVLNENSHAAIEYTNSMLQLGDTGKEVEQLQRRLNELGYDAGKADGIFGPKTQKALETFQEKTHSLVKEEYKLGEKSDEIKKIQKELIEAGYDIGNVDGIYGKKTQEAWKNYKNDGTKAVKGVYDAVTHYLLMDELDFYEGIDKYTTTEVEQYGKLGKGLERIKRIAKGIFAVVNMVKTVIVEAVRLVSAVVMPILGPIIDAVMSIGAYIGDALVSADALFSTGVVVAFETAIAGVSTSFEWVREKIDAAKTSLETFLGMHGETDEAGNEIFTIGKLWRDFKATLESTGVYQTLVDTWDKIKTTFEDVKTRILSLFEGKEINWDGVKNILSAIGNTLAWVVGLVGSLIAGLVQLALPIFSKIPDAIATIKNWVTGIWKDLKISEKIDKLTKRIGNFGRKVYEFFFGKDIHRGRGGHQDGLIDKARKWLTGIWEQLGMAERIQKWKENLKGFFKGIYEFFFGKETEVDGNKVRTKGFFGKAKDWFGEIWEKLGLAEKIQNGIESVKNFWKSVKEFFFGKKADDAAAEGDKKSTGFLGSVLDWLDGISDKLNIAENIDATMASLDGWWGRVKEFFFGKDEEVDGEKTHTKGWLENTGDWLSGIWAKISESETIQAWIAKAKSLPETLHDFWFGDKSKRIDFTGKDGKVYKLMDMGFLENAKRKLFGFDVFDGEGNKTHVNGWLSNIWEWLTGLWKGLGMADRISGWMGKLKGFGTEIWTFFFGSENAETGVKTEGWFSRAWKWIKELLFGKSDEKALEGAEETINDKTESFGGRILKALESGIGWVLDLFGGSAKADELENAEKKPEKTVFQRIGETLSNILKSIGDFLLNVLKGAADFAMKAITIVWPIVDKFMGVLLTLSLYNFSAASKKLAKAVNNFAKAKKYNALSGVLKQLGKVILTIAVTIGVIAFSIYKIGNMGEDEFKRGVSAMAGILISIAGLVAASILLKKPIMNSKDSFELLGKLLLGMGVMIAAMGTMIWLLSRMDFWTFMKGLGYMTLMLGVLFGFMFLVKKFVTGNGDAVNVTKELSLFLLAMGAVVLVLGHMEFVKAQAGVLALLEIAAIMAGLLFVIKKFQPVAANGDASKTVKSLVQLMAVMGVLVIVLGHMGTDKLIQGGIAIAVISGLLAGLMHMMSKMPNNQNGFGNEIRKSMMGVALGILSIAAALYIIKDVDTEKILAFSLSLAFLVRAIKHVSSNLGSTNGTNLKQGWSVFIALCGLALLVAVLGAAISFVGQYASTEQILSFTLALGVLAVMTKAAMNKLQHIPRKSVKSGVNVLIAFLGIAAIVVALGFAMRLAKDVTPEQAKSFALALAALAAGMWAVMSSMSKVSDKNVHQGVTALLAFLGMSALMVALGFGMRIAKDVSEAQIRAFTRPIIALMGGMALILATAPDRSNVHVGVDTLLACLGACAVMIALGVGLLIADHPSVSEVEAFGDAITKILLITAAAIIITPSAANAKKGLNNLLALIGVAGALYAFGAGLSFLNGKDIKADQITAFANGFSVIIAALGAFVFLTGSVGIQGVGVALVALLGLVVVLAGVFAAIGGLLDIPAVRNFSIRTVEHLGEIIGSFTGAMKAAELRSLSKSIGAMNDIEEPETSKLDSVILVSKKMAELSESIPKESVFEKVLTLFGMGTLGTFSHDIGVFSTNFNHYAQTINSIDALDSENSDQFEKKSDTAITIARSLLDFQTEVKDKIDSSVFERILSLVGLSQMSSFYRDMTSFAKGIGNYIDAISQFPNEGFSEDNWVKKSDTAVEISKSVLAFSEALGESEAIPDSLWEKILSLVGLSDMNVFVKDLDRFAQGIGEYIKAIEQFPETTDSSLKKKSSTAVAIAGEVAGFSKSLGSSDVKIDTSLFGKIKALAGLSELDYFVGDLNKFSEGIGNYLAAIGEMPDSTDITETKAAVAVRIAQSVAEFAGLKTSTVDESTWAKVESLNGAYKLSDFAEDIGAFGTGIDKYVTALKKIPDSSNAESNNMVMKAEVARSILDSLIEFGSVGLYTNMNDDVWENVFALDGAQRMVDFSSDMGAFATGLQKYIDVLKSIPLDTEMTADNMIERSTAAVSIADSVRMFGIAKLGSIQPETWETVFGLSGAGRLATFATGIQSFGAGIKNYVAALAEIPVDPDGTTGGIVAKSDAAVTIAKSVLTFATEKLQTIDESDWQKLYTLEGASKLASFSDDLSSFGEGIKNYVGAMAVIPDTKGPDGEFDIVAKSEAAVKIAKSILSFAKDTLKPIPDDVFVSINSLTGFDKLNHLSSSMGDFSEGMSAYVDVMNKIPDVKGPDGEFDIKKKSDAAVSMAQSVLEFAKKDIQPISDADFNTIYSLSSFSSLSGFADELTSFSGGMQDYIDVLAEIPETTSEGGKLDILKKSDAAIQMARSVLTFRNALGEVADKDSAASKLQDVSSTFDLKATFSALASMFGDTGSEEMTTFAKDMGTFAGGIEEYSKQMSKVTISDEDLTKTENATAVATSIVGFVNTLTGSSVKDAGKKSFWEMLTGQNTTIEEFQTQIGKFAESIASLGGAFDGFAEGGMTAGYNEAETVFRDFKAFLEELEGETIYTSKFNELSESFYWMGLRIGEFVGAAGSVDNLHVFGDIFSGLASLITTVPTLDKDQFSSGMTDALDAALGTVGTYSSDFETVGKNLTNGLATGIANPAAKSGVMRALIDLANEMKTTIKDQTGVASPSKVFAEIGRYLDAGLAKGIADDSDVVNSPIEEMCGSVISLTEGTFDRLNALLSMDDEDALTIRPVVDLSEVAKGSEQMHTLLSGNETMSVGVRGLGNIDRYVQQAASAYSAGKSTEIRSGDVLVQGNTFYVRNEQDIDSLASRIAALMRQQQRSLGSIL